jgi:hypothetical protein
MTLPSDFQFSQANLQDYEECHRRFQLRYLRRLSWPAIPAEPVLENEHHLQMGSQFHRLVQQYLLGLPVEGLSSFAVQGNLQLWWDNFLDHIPSLPGFSDNSIAKPLAEISLSAQLAGYRLVAKYDALTLFNDQSGKHATIFDWKTYRKQPSRPWLASRLQTRLYPFLLVQAGSHLNQGAPIPPDQIEMVYWFANFPAQPERFPYTSAQYEEDRAYLTAMLQEIAARDEQAFDLTSHVERCRFCVYRSLCQRGIQAGSIEQMEVDWRPDLEREENVSDLDLDLDFEQIAEIEF